MNLTSFTFDLINIMDSGTYASAGNVSVDLTGITGASSVEVRLAIADNTGSNGQATFVQNLELNGDVVPIPEPSSTTLLGLGGLALILRRRK